MKRFCQSVVVFDKQLCTYLESESAMGILAPRGIRLTSGILWCRLVIVCSNGCVGGVGVCVIVVEGRFAEWICVD